MITRRCSERRLMLSPTPFVLETFAYVIALAAERTGVLVHVICVMGNHYHACVTDPLCRISDFYHYIHEFTTKVLNTKRGRWENMWSIEETSRVGLEDVEAVIDKVGYTLLNPVESLLVSKASQWTGLRLWWGDAPLVVKRPTVFFRKDGKMPATATLKMVPPPCFDDLEDKGVGFMTAYLAEREKRFRDDARAKGLKFVGMRNILKQHWNETPTSFAMRRGLRPRIATRNKQRRIEAIQRDQQFVKDHAIARKKWLEGIRDWLWPAGTYLMRVLHNVPCHPAPT
jgi:REP element-mobilizing transposase RayT